MKAKFSLLTTLIVGVVAFLILTSINKPNMFAKREGMVNKKCPDGTRTDGPCLLEFPTS
jgi:hypothetical protein